MTLSLTMPSADPAAATQHLLKRCCQALDDKKAVELRLLDVAGKSSITNYLIIATASSAPHLKALRGALEGVLKEEKASISGSEFGAESGWLVVDAFEVMAHLFLPAQRDHYHIEGLWKDAKAIDIRDWLKSR